MKGRGLEREDWEGAACQGRVVVVNGQRVDTGLECIVLQCWDCTSRNTGR